MTIKELTEKRKALIVEIDSADEKRFAEIKSEVEKIDYQIRELKNSDEERTAKEKEAEERAARLPSEGVTETRGKTILFSGENIPQEKEMDKKTALRFAKSALGKQVRAKLGDLEVKLDKNEKRALGIAVTTTSETYKAPSESENGVNNGGIFIPQNVLYDLLELDIPESPFLRDVSATHIKGALIFPYVLESDNGSTRGKKETVPAEDRSIKWGKLSLAQGNYPLTIEVTMELLSMTDEEFADYLLADLGNEINFLLSDEVLYGTGTDDRIAGVTVGAISGTEYEKGGEAVAIKEGLMKLSRRARNGAKIYISRALSLDLTFEKDTSGRYIFPIYNNTGISSIATIPVEVEEGLHDGDFIIGNPKNYKLNFTKPTEIYPELHGKTRVIEYTAHLMIAGKAAPNKFYYGKKKKDSKPQE